MSTIPTTSSTTSSTTSTNISTTHVPIDYTDGAPLHADDPRAAMARSVQAARAIIARVDESNASNATPCAEWNAFDLARHLIAVLERAAAGPTDEDINTMPLLADVDLADLVTEAQAAAERVHANWADSDAMETMIGVPWGEFPGAVVIGVYACETLVHVWDLAVSIGVTLDWPDADTQTHLEMSKLGIPASPRGEFMPFDPVVRPADDAPVVEHLVGWQGRDVDRWRVTR